MTEVTETAAPADAGAPPPELKLSDLQHTLQIIDVAATRGAFRGPELSGVGTVRDRLAAFVTHMTPPTEEAAAGDLTDAEQQALTEAAADIAADPAPKKKSRRAKGE